MPVVLETEQCAALIVNAADIFERPDFFAWLNDPANIEASWYRAGTVARADDIVGVVADCFLYYVSGGDSWGMPPDIEAAIIRAINDRFVGEQNDGVIIWLKNV